MFEFTHLVPNLEWFQHYGKAFLSLKENISWALTSWFPVTRDWVTSKGLKWLPWGSSCHCPFKRSALDQFRPFSWWFFAIHWLPIDPNHTNFDLSFRDMFDFTNLTPNRLYHWKNVFFELFLFGYSNWNWLSIKNLDRPRILKGISNTWLAGLDLLEQMGLWAERASADKIFWEALDMFLVAFSKKINIKILVWAEGRAEGSVKKIDVL